MIRFFFRVWSYGGWLWMVQEKVYAYFQFTSPYPRCKSLTHYLFSFVFTTTAEEKPSPYLLELCTALYDPFPLQTLIVVISRSKYLFNQIASLCVLVTDDAQIWKLRIIHNFFGIEMLNCCNMALGKERLNFTSLLNFQHFYVPRKEINHFRPSSLPK